MFEKIAGYKGATEEGIKSRPKGFKIREKVHSQGSTGKKELGMHWGKEN